MSRGTAGTSARPFRGRQILYVTCCGVIPDGPPGDGPHWESVVPLVRTSEGIPLQPIKPMTNGCLQPSFKRFAMVSFLLTAACNAFPHTVVH
jgi:hypothetical protein